MKKNIFKMQQMYSMSDLKIWFNDFKNQKTFLQSLNYLIMNSICLGKMMPEFANMNYHLPNIMKELGLTDNINNKKKVIYVVKISNIDTSLEVKKINGFFNGCGCAEQKFPAKNGKSIGFGEMIFSKKETAKRVIKKFNGINLCGDKKIIMRLRKRVKQA